MELNCSSGGPQKPYTEYRPLTTSSDGSDYYVEGVDDPNEESKGPSFLDKIKNTFTSGGTKLSQVLSNFVGGGAKGTSNRDDHSVPSYAEVP